MDGSTAQARRYYHHVINGGTLNERDVARMVEAMEAKDAEIARLTAALAEAEARSAALVAGAYEAAALEANALGDGHDGEEMAEAIRALTPADATEALARLIAEARAKGMREAAEICWSKKDEDDFRYWGAGAVDHQLRGAMIGKQRDIRALAQKEAASDFPPPHCTAWEDCKHDGICHDFKCCGATGPNHEAFFGEAGE